ncbi:MAG: magnesium transporter CorA family protein [Oligoflexia bacterium]|nr:magnesium transporter CorA family protein [Oligoflexia bacterium]
MNKTKSSIIHPYEVLIFDQNKLDNQNNRDKENKDKKPSYLNREELSEVLEKIKKDKTKTIWINLIEANVSTFEPLLEVFELHPLTVEDCTNEDQLPKIDFFPNYTFFIINFFRSRGASVKITEFDFIVGNNFLITAHKRPSSSSSSSEPIENLIVDYSKLNFNSTSLAITADFLAYQLIDQLNERKFTVIEKIQEEINLEEDWILKEEREGEKGRVGNKKIIAPEKLIKTRRKIIYIRKSIFHERELLYKICRKDSPFIGENMIYYYRNLYDQLFKFLEFTEILREEISSLLELYLSIKSNHLAEISNQTNQVVKKLTLFTTIFMPLTLITGIGGMSEWSMMTSAFNWWYTYPLFILLLVFMGYGNYLWFKKKIWQ